MAATTELMESRLASIKAAVKSTATCTTSTLTSLQWLLQSTPPAGEKTKTTKRTQTATSTKSVTRTRSTRSRNPLAIAKLDVSQALQDEALSLQQRLVLATEVFNTASKALSDALQRNAAPKTPLQPTSPNQIVSSPKRLSTKPTKPAPSVKKSPEDDLIPTAECAILALTTLRNLKGEKSPKIENGNLQLEQGACILAGRLIALGANELAHRELRALKRRLQEIVLLLSTKTSKDRSTPDVKADSAKETIADLLTFSNIDSAGPVLALLVSFQSHVLKLIAAERKISAIEKTCKALSASNSSSPAGIIVRSLEAGNLHKDKAAIQLLSTSNTILSLSSMLQKAAVSTTDPTTTRSTRPFSVLTLQLVSMEYRTMSWELSSHTGDSKREFLDPLSRFLDGLVNSDSIIDSSAFTALSANVQRLQSRMTKCQMKGATNSWRISYSLGKIAQEASCFKESLKHFSSAAEKITEEDPMALSLIQCRIAIIYLYLFKNNKVYPSVVESLANAALALKSANRGSASDLEALLVESARLKKIAMAKLGELLSADRDLPKGMLMSTMDFLHAFIRFLRRYISRQQPNAAEGETDVQMQALITAKNIIITATESAIALGKMSLLNHLPPWEDLQPIFSDSSRLLSSLEQLDTENTEERLDWRSTLVKLSNLFWSRYLKKKEVGAGCEELIPLLDQSISILQGCPISQRTTAFTTLKLERLAHLYLDARMGAKSITCFERSIQEYIDTGTLEQQMAYLSGKPPHVCLQDPKSPGFNLTRVLSSFLKMQLRRPTNDDNGTSQGNQLDVGSRGFLLEWQLSLLADFSSHDLASERFKNMFQELLSEILSLYSRDRYLVRRLRVLRLVLRFALDHPDSLETSTTESLAQDAELHLLKFSAEAHGPYAPFVTHSLKLLLLLRDGDMKEDDFRDVIAFWASTLRDCKDWKSIQAVIDDYDILLAQAQAASDFLEARGYWKLHLAASEIILRIYELQEARDDSSLILALSRCALQYCRLGDHKAALDLLDRAKRRLTIGGASCYAVITYQLVFAELNMEINNTDSAEKTLRECQELFRTKEAEEEVQGSRSQSKIAWERLIVDGALLYSRLADQKKCLSEALYYGKLAVRLSTRLWTKLERSAGRKKQSEKPAESMSDVDLVIDGVANIDLSSTVTSSVWTYAQGAVFWKHVASHNACFLNLMRLSAYNGLFQDAIYYGEQALKVNETLGISVRLLACQAELGLEWIRGSHLTDAKNILDAATRMSEGLINSVETVRLKISQAALKNSQGNYKEVLRLLHEAEAMLDRVSEVRLDSSINVKSSVSALEEKMSLLKIRQASVQNEVKKMTTRTTRKTKATPKAPAEIAESIVTPTVRVQPRSYIALRNEIIRQQIHALLAIEDLDGASHLLEIARDTSPTAAQISIQIEETEHLLADAMKSIAAHAVYCVLPESTLSMPSIEAVISATKMAVARSKTQVTRKGKSTPKEPARATKVTKKQVDVADIMSQARSAISVTVRDAVSTGSTIEGHTASSLMGRVSMLSHATTPGLVDEDILAPVNANELGRITAFARERLAISIDKSLSDYSDPMSWPKKVLSESREKADIIANFTQDYVDILPDGWNVLSISLNSDRTEFIISRMSHGSSPFLLRLPLKRSEEDSQDEDDFTFDWGKQEMKEIIKLANASAHDAKTRVDKNSKKQWWATRESLDRRLETLMENMENIWLGGFRGIFDTFPRDSAILTQFAGSFEKVLNKHLPSRRKSKDKKEKIKVHENVLSLFIGLRDLDKQENPEDSVLDLLYFVVDILQFQGERNAYDEIDFDMMVIDTLDILNNVHSNNSSEWLRSNHTVLILDKSLHCFPWESLPCLHGLPVSRMPSLECLRERIVHFRSLEDSSDGAFEVNRHNGHFILNPSGDLKTTQSTFEEELSQRQGWSAVIGRTPSEEEFKAGLEEKDIFLYFGHGSGAQYIRGRTIKRLDKCAVAFLMGCSSGCLTEAGELEPYGTPMNYMQAGSPALVATLWDVTDKDIDRFAKSTFQQWGLIPGDEYDSEKGKGKKKSTKGKGAESSHGLSNALDEAIARSRSSCLLKYLNGAAPVIYGIPVYLSK